MVAYEDRLRTENAWDFAGLVPGAVRLLETEPALLARLQGQIEFLFVDEAQDLNACQWRLIRLLAGLRRNVTLVASEPQEIYSWRGADYAAIRGGIRDSWPGTPELLLDRSWRCTERILRVAAAPLDPARYPELAVRPERPGGEKVQIQVLESDRQEPGWVRDWVQAQHAKGRAWRDIAVLTRTGRQLAPIARALEAAHIPRDLSGRHSLLQQQEVRVALGYLAIACLPEDLAERHLELTLRKPTRGIGDATLKVLRGDHEGVTWSDLRAALSADKPAVKVEVIEQITRYLALVTGLRDLHAAGTRPDELLEQALRLSGYYLYLADQEEDVEAGLNLEALKGQAAEFDDPIAFLRSIDDRLLKAFQADPGQGVQLATLSATKGLEFGAVLIAGCEEGLLPHYRATTEALAEVERRLFYVGATRARDTLRLLACRRRNNRDVPVSRILKCLPLDDVEWRMEGFYVS
jgi:superfamily I DNA/RNA helicase